jgi:hypothetical protein
MLNHGSGEAVVPSDAPAQVCTLLYCRFWEKRHLQPLDTCGALKPATKSQGV